MENYCVFKPTTLNQRGCKNHSSLSFVYLFYLGGVCTISCISWGASWIQTSTNPQKATSNFPKQLPVKSLKLWSKFIYFILFYFYKITHQILALNSGRLWQKSGVARISPDGSAGSRTPSDGSDLLLWRTLTPSLSRWSLWLTARYNGNLEPQTPSSSG